MSVYTTLKEGLLNWTEGEGGDLDLLEFDDKNEIIHIKYNLYNYPHNYDFLHEWTVNCKTDSVKIKHDMVHIHIDKETENELGIQISPDTVVDVTEDQSEYFNEWTCRGLNRYYISVIGTYGKKPDPYYKSEEGEFIYMITEEGVLSIRKWHEFIDSIDPDYFGEALSGLREEDIEEEFGYINQDVIYTNITNSDKLKADVETRNWDTLTIFTVDTNCPIITFEKIKDTEEYKFLVDIQDKEDFRYRVTIKTKEELNKAIDFTINAMESSAIFSKYINDIEKLKV